MFRRIAVSLALLCSLSVSGCTSTGAAAGAQCDRECLRGFVTRYLSALIKRDPSQLPLADNVRFTEDSVEKKLGDGLWKSATRLRSYRQDFLDAHTGIAGSHVVLEEGGTPLVFVVRLKIANKKISEIETMTIRGQKEGLIYNVDTLTTAIEAMNLMPAKAQLHSREDAIKIAETYPTGLKIGSFAEAKVPFTADAYRLENGVFTAGPSCTISPTCKDIKTQPSPKRPSVEYKLIAVDEEAGIVWYRLTWARGAENKLVVWEAFKVYGGQMHAVEGMTKLAPASLGSGWD